MIEKRPSSPLLIWSRHLSKQPSEMQSHGNAGIYRVGNFCMNIQSIHNELMHLWSLNELDRNVEIGIAIANEL